MRGVVSYWSNPADAGEAAVQADPLLSRRLPEAPGAIPEKTLSFALATGNAPVEIPSIEGVTPPVETVGLSVAHEIAGAPVTSA
jgi:hypothetical protein